MSRATPRPGATDDRGDPAAARGAARPSRLAAVTAAPIAFACALVAAPAGGQTSPPNQFGGQDRADAAARMIVIGVQQGISSLPPTSGQSFVYDYDPAIDTYVQSRRLGPISFRSPLTIGREKLSFRVATSYFELSDSFGPVPYAITSRADGSSAGFTEFGLSAEAKVGLINVGATYGITDRLELSVNFPLAIVDAQAEQSFPVLVSDRDAPPGQASVVSAGSLQTLDELLALGLFVLRSESFDVEGKEFNQGTHVGLGRTSLGGKFLLLSRAAFRLAFSGELFLPSPNEDEFAGSDSTAILPRLIGMFEASDAMRMHVDIGYDYDFDVDELSRFTWNTGASVALPGVTFDFGVGGSKFSKAVRWTPPTTTGEGGDFPAGGVDLTALGDVTLATNTVDFLGGFKIRLGESATIGGSVNVPLTSDGFRADAVGTIAGEVYF